MINITRCPSCGSNKIRQIRKNRKCEFRKQSFIVPSLEFYECPACGEKIYDREAMRKIEQYSPAFGMKQKMAVNA